MLTEQAKGAAIGQFAAALVNLDAAVRTMQTHGQLRHGLKAQLNILQAHADKFLVASQKQFDCSDADAVNVLSEVIGTACHLLLQLTPAQIESSLAHMRNMADHNLTYVPTPVKQAA